MSQPKKFAWKLEEGTTCLDPESLKGAEFTVAMEDQENGEYELMYAYRELDYFMDITWSDSEFHSDDELKWIPPNTDEKHLLHMELDQHRKMGYTSLPLKTKYYNLSDAVPIPKRKQPIFMVCSPSPHIFRGIPNPLTTLQNFDGCENCGAYHDQTNLEKFRYLFCAFPLPYRDLPEVPDDTAKLPRDSLFILCLGCLHERFVRVCGYRTRSQNMDLEKPLWPTKYLPYNTMFGVNMIDALLTESMPSKWGWHTQGTVASPIPIFTGFYVLAKTLIPSTKKAANFQ